METSAPCGASAEMGGQRARFVTGFHARRNAVYQHFVAVHTSLFKNNNAEVYGLGVIWCRKSLVDYLFMAWLLWGD